jgi:hypothetical protein
LDVEWHRQLGFNVLDYVNEFQGKRHCHLCLNNVKMLNARHVFAFELLEFFFWLAIVFGHLQFSKKALLLVACIIFKNVDTCVTSNHLLLLLKFKCWRGFQQSRWRSIFSVEIQALRGVLRGNRWNGKQESSRFPNLGTESKDFDNLIIKIFTILIKELTNFLYRFVPIINVLHFPPPFLWFMFMSFTLKVFDMANVFFDSAKNNQFLLSYNLV